jgi:allophanate hydrolase subunit 2
MQDEFTVSTQSNRVGVRLQGSISGDVREIVSEPACPGTIQITAGGTPIILGPDGPTIGGYPKIGVVIRADLDRVGQLRPGAAVHFEAVSIEAALGLWKERELRLQRVIAELSIGDR